MADLRERLQSIEQKHKRFKQQQFTFIAALERSREHALDKTTPVSSVAQVQRYMTHHCSNAIDRRVFSLFLEIVADLEVVYRLVESTYSEQNQTSESLETCRKLLSPKCNISKLQAHFPHDEINRLSCNEARNYYGGVVSVIPLALDLLKVASIEPTGAPVKTLPPTQLPTNVPPQPSVTNAENSTENTPLNQSMKTPSNSKPFTKATSKGAEGWHAGKPAWRPPGRRRI